MEYLYAYYWLASRFWYAIGHCFGYLDGEFDVLWMFKVYDFAMKKSMDIDFAHPTGVWS